MARSKLEACGRLGVDEADNEFIDIHGLGKTSVQDTATIHQPANVVGLPLIRKLVITIGVDRPALTQNGGRLRRGGRGGAALAGLGHTNVAAKK